MLMSAQIDEGMNMSKDAVEAKKRQDRASARIGARPMDGTVRKVPALHDLGPLRAQTVRELDVPGKDGADLPSWDDLREGWYDERLEKA